MCVLDTMLIPTYKKYFSSLKLFDIKVVQSDNMWENIKYLQHVHYFQEGGFFSAEDADSLPNPDAPAKREGAFYVWTYDRLKTLLKNKVPGKDNLRYLDLICRQFSVRKEGNVESPQVCFAVEIIKQEIFKTKFVNVIVL